MASVSGDQSPQERIQQLEDKLQEVREKFAETTRELATEIALARNDIAHIVPDLKNKTGKADVMVIGQEHVDKALHHYVVIAYRAVGGLFAVLLASVTFFGILLRISWNETQEYKRLNEQQHEKLAIEIRSYDAKVSIMDTRIREDLSVIKEHIRQQTRQP